MALNVSNMPMNTLYKFANNSYVWSIMLKETRGGNYRDTESSKYTEVYRIDDTGRLLRETSGRLVSNPDAMDFNKRFSIFDPDADCCYSFFVETPLEEVNMHELYRLRDAIARSYESRNK